MTTCRLEDSPDAGSTPSKTRSPAGNGDGLHLIIDEMRRRISSPLLRGDHSDQAPADLSGNFVWKSPQISAHRRKRWVVTEILQWTFFLAVFFTFVALLCSWVLLHRESRFKMARAVDELQQANASLSSKCRTFERTIHELRKELTDLKGNIHNVCALDSVQEHVIKKVVDHSLEMYDADKTGLADYALESAGGAVLSTPHTAVYHMKHWLHLLGLPVAGYSPCGGPRCIIQRSVQPGYCWTFQGSTGRVKLRLARKIHVRAVTMENTPANIAIANDVTCAPKKFVVYAMIPGPGKNLIDLRLGIFEYEISGPALQTFKIQDADVESSSVVHLQVASNHGHPQYTCVCRFRVHGVERHNDTLPNL